MSDENEVKTIQDYDESTIRTLDPLEHVRSRPGMYIGRLGDGSHRDDGIYVLLKEVIDNSIDEFMMGYGRRIDISLDGDRVSVRDYGRGIPLEMAIACVSKMNTGGKYGDSGYSSTIGMNGVGTKAVNALSEEFIIRSYRDGKFKEGRFAKGKLIEELDGETTEKNGTFVSYVADHDKKLFGNYKYSIENIEHRLWMYAYLNTGLSLYFNGERFYSQNGLKDLLDEKAEEEKIYDIIYYRGKKIEFALTHVNSYGESCYSFVNGQYTSDGGTHLSAFKEGVLKAINEFTEKSYKADEVRDGMLGAISIKLVDPIFESQTKNKLGSTEVRGPIVAEVKKEIVDFLFKNKEAAEKILEKIQLNEQLHKRVAEAKKLGKEAAKKLAVRIPKLKDCKFHRGDKDKKGNPLPETMIFLAEGDSAAGSFVLKRDVNTQAIFALKGKPFNCYGEDKKKLYENDELRNIMYALDIESEVDNLRYDKVVIATDADVDGMHIRNLLITYFLTYFDQLVMSGHLYILETPLYRVKTKKHGSIYCYSDSERDEAIANVGKEKFELTRFKGLGEISPEELGEFIGDNIKLVPVTLDHLKNVPEILGFYMGDNSPSRREYIMNNLEISIYE
ncbi:MAG: type IIA DNA topoisomerase subunit B [Lentisphaeria bacterium]|nr:type IIA DNA topoisomerase subunit B [Lentisphaeria bacterium]